MTRDSKELPTDPLADASTGVVRRSRGAFLKSMPARHDRRNPTRQSRHTGPEHRKEEEKPAEAESEIKHLLGLPRWLVIAAAIYVGALAIAMALIFTY